MNGEKSRLFPPTPPPYIRWSLLSSTTFFCFFWALPAAGPFQSQPWHKSRAFFSPQRESSPHPNTLLIKISPTASLPSWIPNQYFKALFFYRKNPYSPLLSTLCTVSNRNPHFSFLPTYFFFFCNYKVWWSSFRAIEGEVLHLPFWVEWRPSHLFPRAED